MGDKFEVGSARLSKVHKYNNNKKLHCYLTGFLEGIVASGRIEKGEVGALASECEAFIVNLNDPDAAEIIEDLKADLLEIPVLEDIIEVRVCMVDPNCVRSEENNFFGFCAGIACDDLITEDEAEQLIKRVDLSENLSKNTLVKAIKYSCTDALIDGIVSAEQSQDICHGISKLVGDSYSDTGLSTLGNVPVFEETTAYLGEIDIIEKTFVLTGNFSVKPRKRIKDAISEIGGNISDNVTLKTDYLVVALEASRDWTHTHKGNKISRALEIKDAKGAISIVSEATLLTTLKLN